MPTLIPVILPVIATSAAFLYGPMEADRAFFEACAQVIPVLLLALTVEAGILRFRSAADDAVFERAREENEARQNAIETIERNLEELQAVAPAGLEVVQKRISRLHAEEEEAQARLRLERDLWQIARVGYVVSGALVLLAGEVVTLLSLAHESFGDGNPRIALAAVVFGFVAILGLVAVPADT